jgi:hypothetical protein
MDAHPDAQISSAAFPTATERIDEPSIARLRRSVSRPAPTARDDAAAQLRARLLNMIVANERSKRSSDSEGIKPR